MADKTIFPKILSLLCAIGGGLVSLQRLCKVVSVGEITDGGFGGGNTAKISI